MSDSQATTAVNVSRDNPAPSMWSGTVTLGGLKPFVLIDGDTDPIPAVNGTEVCSTGMRVLCSFLHAGACVITGAVGGFQHALGWAGTDTAQTGITAETDLLDDNGDVMEVGFEVLHPNRLIVVTAFCRVERNDAVAIPSPILRAKWDNDGTPATLGILAESTPLIPDGANVGLTGSRAFLDATYQPPDPGEFTVWLSLSAGGTGTVDTLSGVTVPGSRCEFWVSDVGPWFPPG